MQAPVISADSHITEPADTYVDRIDAKWRDKAPRLVHIDEVGDVFQIDGIGRPVPMGLVAAAGKPAHEIRVQGVRFEEMHRGGWDPVARLADQDRDGVAAEVIYPTVGMVLCNHKDFDYKKACFDAYNRWIAEYCATSPSRLIGCGQTALRTPQEGIEDLAAIAKLGLRGVMLPGNPAVEDYHSTVYDPFWEAAVEIGLPLSFHILTTPHAMTRARGPVMNFAVAIIRANQDIIGMLIYGGVFARHPKLRIVCVEADAGWAPHWMYRMDHYYERHHHLRQQVLERRPSEYFREHVYLTFQDDWAAFRTAELQNPERLMWANDFPHSDSTWPRSQAVLREHTAGLDAGIRDRILHDNAAALYGLA
jgi:predicted TIM-barrel fold metal-dependent hydrolase